MQIVGFPIWLLIYKILDCRKIGEMFLVASCVWEKMGWMGVFVASRGLWGEGTGEHLNV